ncbi:hypothetical protein BDZ94DRAFT_1256993 [Collybia nuda]|uniref:Uncharacterized protein n=1 Tax=Collybia nuda TaxID=64659 RepID=A0A9P5Y8I0_9AGAR|nr:hypothetical protein BDZ94DRAFT_1256993 [Collybia nuda]
MLIKWLPVALTAIATAQAAVLDDNLPTKRSCTVNGCRCRPGSGPGLHCGRCPEILDLGTGGLLNGVFECNPAGGCCYYGESTSCASPVCNRHT